MRVGLAAALVAALLGGAWLSGCNADVQEREPLSPGDSVATAREAAASLAGNVAPGAQTYSYRELYAGMTRRALEQRAPVDSATGMRCEPDTTRGAAPRQTHCAFDTRFPRDEAPAHVEVIYVPERGGEVARDITVSRALPLDVDGPLLARALATAFEKQTTFLDRREESFGKHSAHIRVGATSAARLNYAEVMVEMKAGREQVTVHLTRMVARNAGG